MPRRIIRKWRPPLAFVLGGTLATVFFLPIIGIAYFRVAGGVLGWAETAWMIFWMAFVATVILGYFLWRLVLRPTRALTEYAQSEGAIKPPVHYGTPEFTELGTAVLSMTQRLQAREAVLRSYADHVTHELKSPLTVVRGAAELLDGEIGPEDRARLLVNIADAVGRMEALLDGQRALAKAQEPMLGGNCLLSEVVRDLPGAVVAADGEVPLSAETLHIVATHLVSNALDHGATEVTLAAQPDHMIIRDNGPGISPGNRDRIFDPFFTTRRDAGGTGMGLPIVRRMLEAQGADITLLPGNGAVFEIRF